MYHLSLYYNSLNLFFSLHGATEVIDEILSDEENKDEKRLKDAELIIDNKHVKDLDNRYREEQGDIVLLKRDDPNLRVDEKHDGNLIRDRAGSAK